MTLEQCFVKDSEAAYQAAQDQSSGVRLKEQYEGLDPQWYHVYEGQMQAQEVYLALTPDGVVEVDYSGEVNRSTIPSTVWNVMELRWTLPPDIHGDGVTALFNEIKPDIVDVVDGWDTDGLRGELSEEAQAISLEIEYTISRIDHESYCSTVACINDALEGIELPDHGLCGSCIYFAQDYLNDRLTDWEAAESLLDSVIEGGYEREEEAEEITIGQYADSWDFHRDGYDYCVITDIAADYTAIYEIDTDKGLKDLAGATIDELLDNGVYPSFSESDLVDALKDLREEQE